MAEKRSGPPSKVIALQLEDVVLRVRTEAGSLEDAVVACNQDLARRNVGKTVSKSTVKRYLATLDKATVPVAHQPQVAEQNAVVAIAFAERLQNLDAMLNTWLGEAETAQKITVVGSGESAYTVETPDWLARTSVAREVRELLKTYADLMQRIHDAEEVRSFQESVVDAIREASPEVAAAVVRKLRERQSIRKAALLGA